MNGGIATNNRLNRSGGEACLEVEHRSPPLRFAGPLDLQNMNQSELLTVEERFAIDQLGLVVIPDFSIPRSDWKPSEETVTIRRPDGSEFEAVAQFNHSHFNIPDPTVSNDRRWRVTVCILNIAKEEVPIGSRLLVRNELANQLLETSQ